jgi:hypothetical protein
MRMLPIVLAVGVVACASEMPTSAAPSGPVTTITSVARTSDGYALTVRVTNADTGAIAYANNCPGRIEWNTGRDWVSVEDSSICRSTAKAIDPGSSLTFIVDQPLSARGSDVRYVFGWFWLNGNGPGGGESVSAAVTVK